MMDQRSAEGGHGPKMTIGITHAPVLKGGFPVSYQAFASLDLSGATEMGPDELRKALADFEIIAAMIREKPDEVAALYAHAVAGRVDAAQAAAQRLGLKEEAFEQRSGGMWWAIALVGGFIAVCAATGDC